MSICLEVYVKLSNLFTIFVHIFVLAVDGGIAKRQPNFLHDTVLTENDMSRSFGTVICAVHFWLTRRKSYHNLLRFAKVVDISLLPRCYSPRRRSAKISKTVQDRSIVTMAD